MAIRRNGNPKLVGAIFAPIGLVLLGVTGWLGNHQVSILKTWPEVDALVTKSRLTRSRSKSTTMYGTEFEFRYTVNGKQYQTPATSSYASSSYTEMKGKIDAYTPGTHHSIHYNPANPNDISYDAGYNLGFFFVTIIPGILGLVFSGLGIALLFASRSERKALCPSCGEPVEKGQRFCPNCAAPLLST